MVCKRSRVAGNLIVKTERIKRVSTYKYLGTVVNEDWDNMEEIRAFQNIQNFLTHKDVNIALRQRQMYYISDVIL